MRLPSWVTVFALGLASSFDATAQLSLQPANPTPLDTVRLRYTHTGCTNFESVKVNQAANAISVQADRIFFPDCGTVIGYYEEFTLGRFPTGDYDVQLVVNPPAGTLGPSQIVGSLHFSVAALPATGSAHPHDNFEDLWWNPAESGWALNIFQSGEKLFLIWTVYDVDRRATWFVVPAGSWSRDANNALGFSGTVYRTLGPPWPGIFDPSSVQVTAVGTATFTPTGTNNAQLAYTIDGASVTKALQRFKF